MHVVGTRILQSGTDAARLPEVFSGRQRARRLRNWWQRRHGMHMIRTRKIPRHTHFRDAMRQITGT